jgi:hypothetical protein
LTNFVLSPSPTILGHLRVVQELQTEEDLVSEAVGEQKDNREQVPVKKDLPAVPSLQMEWEWLFP